MAAEMYLTGSCPRCNGTIGIFNEDDTDHLFPFTVSCQKCGAVFYHGNDASSAAKYFQVGSFKKYGADKVNTSTKVFTMNEAYEANKASEFCVVCGKPTKPNYALTPFIMYCSCVENLH